MSLVFTFPGGQIHEEKDSAVDGNINTDLTVPSGKNWIFQSLFVSLVADGVANRRILCRTFNSSGELLDAGIQNSANITDGQTRSLSLVNNTSPVDDQGIEQAGDYRGQFSFGGSLKAGDIVRIRIVSGLAGDKYEYRLRVRAIGGA